MVRLRHHSKIFETVIISNTIQMMHKFCAFQNTPQMLFNHKTMFKNITIMVCKWMVRFFYSNVTLRCFRSTILIPMMLSTLWIQFKFHFLLLKARATPSSSRSHWLATFRARDSIFSSTLRPSPSLFQLTRKWAMGRTIFRIPSPFTYCFKGAITVFTYFVTHTSLYHPIRRLSSGYATNSFRYRTTCI